MNNCSICKSDKNIITHHLSYEPEITIQVCRRCETMMHRLADLLKMPQSQQDIINGFVSQYGHLWEDTRKKYKKSERSKNVEKKYQKTDKFKNTQKKYRETDKRKDQLKEYYFRGLTPEKMLKRIEKMEKLLLRQKDEKI